LGPLALATDAGGSTRRPAAHAGVVGFKPTLGAVPHPWGFADPNQALSSIGQVGRHVDDVALLFDTLRGYHAADPLSWPAAADTAEAAPTRPLRMAFSPDLGLDYPLDDDVRLALDNAVGMLSKAGHHIERVAPQWPADLASAPLLALQHAGLAALFGERCARQPELFDRPLAEQIAQGREVSGAQLASLLMLRERIAAAVAAFFEDHDVLLAPTTPVEAWPLDRLGPRHIGGRPAGPRGHAVFTPLFNFAGVPALSLPCGFGRHGLPLGMQVIGPKFHDARVLHAARDIERIWALDMRSPLLRDDTRPEDAP
ncbi:MAG: amidase, partial [Rhodocyclaceae bacterium]